jgi:hypothetical protein
VGISFGAMRVSRRSQISASLCPAAMILQCKQKSRS